MPVEELIAVTGENASECFSCSRESGVGSQEPDRNSDF